MYRAKRNSRASFSVVRLVGVQVTWKRSRKTDLMLVLLEIRPLSINREEREIQTQEIGRSKDREKERKRRDKLKIDR
jgi:hypothetical protein